MIQRILAPAVALAVLSAGCGIGAPTPPPCPTSPPTAQDAPAILTGAETATVVTSLGEFTITLDASSAPIATANFVSLARCGFYDGQSFHRVLAGFVIQAGDPQTRDDHGAFPGLGTGGPGYHFPIELPTTDQSYDPYTVAMANSNQPDSNGSQFFICLVDLDNGLARTYSIFGNVTDGTDVVDAIGQVPVNNPRDGVPVEPVIINSITVSGGAV